MTKQLQGRRIPFLVANEGVEQVELTQPWEAVRDAGGTPELVAPEAGTVQAFNHLDKGDTFPVDRTVADVRVDDYDALVLPDGVANPDRLRTIPEAVAFVRAMFETGRPAGVICHGPWTIVEADQVRGRTITSWPSLRTDIHNAGGTWVDREVQTCTNGPNVLISSRRPDDLPAFCATIVDQFSRQRQPA